MFTIVPKERPEENSIIITANQAVGLIDALATGFSVVDLDARAMFSIQEMRELVSQIYTGATEAELVWARKSLELACKAAELNSMVSESTVLKYQERMMVLVAKHIEKKERQKNEKD